MTRRRVISLAGLAMALVGSSLLAAILTGCGGAEGVAVDGPAMVYFYAEG